MPTCSPVIPFSSRDLKQSSLTAQKISRARLRVFKTRPHCQRHKCMKFSGQTCIHCPFITFLDESGCHPMKMKAMRVSPDRQIHGCSACQLELVALMLREGKTSMNMNK